MIQELKSLAGSVKRLVLTPTQPAGERSTQQHRIGLVTQKERYRARHIGDNMIVADSTSVKKDPVIVRLDTADPFIFNEVFIEEIYNLDNTRIGDKIEDIYQRLLAEHVPLILDLGGNVGYTSLYYADRYPKSFIVSVECETNNFDFLRRNTVSYPNIMAVHAAIDSEGERQVCVADRDTESTTSCFRSCRFVIRPNDSPSSAVVETVKTYTVNKLIDQVKELQPKVVPFICKIDIEGHEKQLFMRNADWLGDFHVLIGEGHDHVFPGEKTAHDMLLTAVKYGFDIMAYSSNFLCVRYS